MKPIVAAIGTTHPLQVAGIGLDLRVADRLGIRVVTVVAGVSAQDARRVLARSALDDALIAAQCSALHGLEIAAIHVGALLDAASANAVASALAGWPGAPVVCDPVIAASGGERLADDATVAALRTTLFPRCALITPNLAEAAALVGAPIDDLAAMERAARTLLQTGARAVLLKGGHLRGEAIDVLAQASGLTRFRAPRIDADLRGTGDLLAVAIAARLAFGDPIVDAIDAAREFVRSALREGVEFAGMRTLP